MTNNEWEKEYHKIIDSYSQSADFDNGDLGAREEIEQFISTLLTQTRQETVREVIEKMQFNAHSFQPVGGISNIKYVNVNDIEKLKNQLREEYKIE